MKSLNKFFIVYSLSFLISFSAHSNISQLLKNFEYSLITSNWYAFKSTAYDINHEFNENMESYTYRNFFNYNLVYIKGFIAQRNLKEAYALIKETSEILFERVFKTQSDQPGNESDELYTTLANLKDYISYKDTLRCRTGYELTLLLAEYYFYKDDFEKAESLLFLLYKYEPYLHSSVCLMLGDIHILKNDHRNAKEFYKKAYRKAKDNGDIHYIIGFIYLGYVKCDLIAPDPDDPYFTKTLRSLSRAIRHFEKDAHALGEILSRLHLAEINMAINPHAGMDDNLIKLEKQFATIQDPYYRVYTLLLRANLKRKLEDAEDDQSQKGHEVYLKLAKKYAIEHDIPLLLRLAKEEGYAPSTSGSESDYIQPNNILDILKKTPRRCEIDSPRSDTSSTSTTRSAETIPRSVASDDAESLSRSGSSTSVTSPRSSASNSQRSSLSDSSLRSSPLRTIPGTRVHTLANSGEF